MGCCVFSFESEAGQQCFECCSKAVELCPTNPEAHQLMASCLLSQQLQEKARDALMKGLSLWLPSCHGNGEEVSGGTKEESEADMTSEVEVCVCVCGHLREIGFTFLFMGYRGGVFRRTPLVWVWPSYYWSWRSTM